MMKKTFLFVWVHVLAVAACAASAPITPPKHLADAKALVLHLSLENTSYGHGRGQVQWEPACISHTDCSGFVDALLMHSYGHSREDFKRWFGSSRPTAHRYHDAIAQGIGFVQVPPTPGKAPPFQVNEAPNVPPVTTVALALPVLVTTKPWSLEVPLPTVP